MSQLSLCLDPRDNADERTVLRRVAEKVEFKNVAMADAGASASYSSSRGRSKSPSDSEWNAIGGCRRIAGPTRTPGFERLKLHELLQVRQMQATARRVRDVTGRGYGADTVLDSSRKSAFPMSKPAPTAQEWTGFNVAVMQENWCVNLRHTAILQATAVFCVVVRFFYLGVTLWIRVKDLGVCDATFATSHAENVDLLLFSGGSGITCHKYMAAMELSVIRSDDPCQDFYRFVCDGSKRQHDLLSVVDAAEDAIYGLAPSSIEWNSEGGSDQYCAVPSAFSVEKEVAGFAKSCMELSRSRMPELKMFMGERHLLWPVTSRWDLLEILLDLSGNWNVRLWFHVSFELALLRDGTGKPVLKIGDSAAFHASIVTVRIFAGQQAGTAASLRYWRYVRAMLHLFDASKAADEELVAKIEAMDGLTLEVPGVAMAELHPRVMRMPIRNLTEAATRGIAAGRLLQLFVRARRFSLRGIVQVENAGWIRSIVYLLGLKSDTRDALTLSLPVAHDLGSMASRDIADITLKLVGPASDIRNAFVGVVSSHQNVLLQLWAPGAIVFWTNESFLASVVSHPTHGARFFVDWSKLMNGRWRLLEQDMTNVLKPGSFLSQRWSFHGALTVAEDCFVFPLFHPHFPAAVNYGGAGRLGADEVLRRLYHEHIYNITHLSSGRSRKDTQQTSDSSSAPQKHSPNQMDLKALLASLAAYWLGVARHKSRKCTRELSLARDSLSFFSKRPATRCAPTETMWTCYMGSRAIAAMSPSRRCPSSRQRSSV
ncbi:hypothetical protein HPB49_022220 [Dermacentor silvarum]|uniref:Uncharacterized protein n=1 Tax=Dermacentor silvarum TaxID=543639 RepID=A0ACB8CHH5_DERSI|nr:hypothetical protein HPB49_022220 [Dermacentor silvarum]